MTKRILILLSSVIVALSVLGAVLVAPPADAVRSWDSSAGLEVWMLPTNGVKITGTNIQADIVASTNITILNTNGTLYISATGGGGTGYSTIQEEGSGLTQRDTMNFIGSTATASDNGGSSRTDITFDSDVNALASASGTGLYIRTGAGTSATRAITAGNGTSVTNGDGVAGNPTVSISAMESGVYTTKTLTANVENIIATIPLTDGEKASFILQWSYDTDSQLGTAAGVSTISILHSGGIVSGFSTQATHSEVGDAIWISPPSYNDGSPVEITFTPDTAAATTVTFRYKIINMSSETITIVP